MSFKKKFRKFPKKIPKDPTFGRSGLSFGGSSSKKLPSSKYRKSKGSVKKFAKKHWKKAAAFGAGAAGVYLGYRGYKKVCEKFVILIRTGLRFL